jgi:hypothetical protein
VKANQVQEFILSVQSDRNDASGYVVKLSATAGDLQTLHSVTAYPRYLWVGTAGTATMTDISGNTLTNFPLKAGRNDIRIASWTAGTAADVWGCW